MDECKKCHPLCKSCFGETNQKCFTCLKNNFTVYQEEINTCACKNNLIFDEKKLQCIFSNSTTESALLKTNNSNFFSNFNNISNCEKGYKLNKTTNQCDGKLLI